MPNLALTCPHCRTEKAGFSGDLNYPFDGKMHLHVALLRCGVCREGIVVKVHSATMPNFAETQIVDAWPAVVSPTAPKDTPDNVKNFYLQGVDNLARRNWDAVGTMFRKTLDTALKKVHPEGRGTLEKRIGALPDSLGVTPAMKEWAHNIRDLGNDAAHEEEPFTEGEARYLYAFTETFLTYAFTLPGMVQARAKLKEMLS